MSITTLRPKRASNLNPAPPSAYLPLKTHPKSHIFSESLSNLPKSTQKLTDYLSLHQYPNPQLNLPSPTT
jgi:hypothetical protein